MTANSRRPEPHDHEAERAVLGSILLAPCAFDTVAAEFSGLDGVFHDEQCAEIWAAMAALRSKGEPIDALSVSAACGEAVSVSNLAALLNAVPTSANVSSYSRRVVERYRRRRVQSMAGRVWRDVARPEAGTDEIIVSIQREIANLHRGGHAAPVSLADGLEGAISRIVDLHERKHTGGLALGFASLDRIIGGLAPGAVCVLAARPGVGKSAMALNVAANVAKAGGHVLFFSLEMPRESLEDRLLYCEAGIDKTRVVEGFETRETLAEKLRHAAAQTFYPRIAIDDFRRATAMDITSRAKAHHRRHALALVVIDYLQLIPPATPRATREAQVAEASREIKILAGELGCPILLLSQFSRAAENEAEPGLHHLRESGAIEQDADVVILLSRAEGDVLRARVAKNRAGAVGLGALHFDAGIQKVRDWHGPLPTAGRAAQSAGRKFKAAPPVEHSYAEDDEPF